MTLSVGSWELVGTHDWLEPEKKREASVQTTDSEEERVMTTVTFPVVASPEISPVPIMVAFKR